MGRYTVSRMLMKTVGDGHLDPSRAYRGIALVERFIEMQPEAGVSLCPVIILGCCDPSSYE